jgi:nitrite reductase/ring-hydroxylating ferredoxin subunit
VLVVSFSTVGRHNCVVVEGEPFVFARSRLGAFVLPARCRHRGGPLHLAALERDRPRLICPWHERRSSVARCLSSGIPAVRRTSTVTAVLPYAAGTPYKLGHRPLSADLALTASSSSQPEHR